MFFKPDSFRLNLAGRKPSIYRNATVTTAGILLITMVLAIAVMVWKNNQVIPGYEKAFAISVSDRNSWSSLVKATEVRTIAQSFERSVQLLADSISELYRSPSCGPLDSLEKKYYRSHILVASSHYASRYEKRKFTLGTQDLLVSKFDTVRVLRDPQLHFDPNFSQWDSTDSIICNTDTGLAIKLFRISELLSRAFVPFETDSVSRRDSTAQYKSRFRYLSSEQSKQSATVFVALNMNLLLAESPEYEKSLDSAKAKVAKRRLLPVTALARLKEHVSAPGDTLHDSTVFAFLASRGGRIDTSFHADEREWLVRAVYSGKPNWTGPYASFDPKIPVVTVSCPIYDPLTKNLIGIAGADIPLSKLNSIESVGTRQAENFFYIMDADAGSIGRTSFTSSRSL